ncbi:uncharacterized protein LOC128964038 [Oppia nitens]|uniref:uncharacterized protein LOC128964038 n=1 Tax=Oppia nitens TaxID=1686743 RepID=UPI0023D98631|nr:uncharacterized protein LOC128964038 [Oppia nitens]
MYWLVSESDEVSYKNAKHLSGITTEWSKIDASIYYGSTVKCMPEFTNKLVLLNFNEKNGKNEILYGTVKPWNWTLMEWSQFEAFNVTKDIIDWHKSIDAIAIAYETVIIFQDTNYVTVECRFKDNKWQYIMNNTLLISSEGPFNAAYFDDIYKHTLPLYLLKDDIYFICYYEINNNVNNSMSNCENVSLNEYSLKPLSKCWIRSDPNSPQFTSMIAHMIIVLLTFLGIAILSTPHLINMSIVSIGDQNAPKDRNTSVPKDKSNDKIDVGKDDKMNKN